jgi:hypothetical protein
VRSLISWRTAAKLAAAGAISLGCGATTFGSRMSGCGAQSGPPLSPPPPPGVGIGGGVGKINGVGEPLGIGVAVGGVPTPSRSRRSPTTRPLPPLSASVTAIGISAVRPSASAFAYSVSVSAVAVPGSLHSQPFVRIRLHAASVLTARRPSEAATRIDQLPRWLLAMWIVHVALVPGASHCRSAGLIVAWDSPAPGVACSACLSSLRLPTPSAAICCTRLPDRTGVAVGVGIGVCGVGTASEGTGDWTSVAWSCAGGAVGPLRGFHLTNEGLSDAADCRMGACQVLAEAKFLRQHWNAVGKAAHPGYPTLDPF